MKMFIPPCLREEIETHFAYIKDPSGKRFPGGGMFFCKTCLKPAMCEEYVDVVHNVAIPIRIVCRSGMHGNGKAPRWRMSAHINDELLKGKPDTRLH